MNKKKYLIYLISVFILVFVLGFGINYAANRLFKIDLFASFKNVVSEKLNLNQGSEAEGEVDERPLELEYDEKKREIYEANTAIGLISNKEIIVDENNKYKLLYIKDNAEGKKYYALELFNIGVGNALIPVVIKDKAGNQEEFTLDITRIDYPLPLGLKEIKDWDGSLYTIDGNNLLAQADKQHKLLDDYQPEDLVDLKKDKQLVPQIDGIMLREEAADHLVLMNAEVKKVIGRDLLIASGYRSYANQYRQYTSWVRQLGQTEADRISARPGFSEHQLGTCVDFQDLESGYEFTNNFANTRVGKWLQENAHKYGYVLSYPEGKEEVTGYSYESWHWRYIGVENAAEFKTSGLTLKEWLATKN